MGFNPEFFKTIIIKLKTFSAAVFSVTLIQPEENTNLGIMKKVFLSMALLGLVAVGTVNAQDQDKKKDNTNKQEQPADLKKDEVKKEDPNTKEQQMSNDAQQKAKEDQQKQYDPNQQPAQPAEPKQDTATPQ